MIEYFRDLRLLPIAMVASACLLVLLAADLLLGQLPSSAESDPSRPKDVTVIHAVPSVVRPKDDKRKDDKRMDRADDRRAEKRSWAQQMFNFPGSKAAPRERDDLSLLPPIAPLPGDRASPDVTSAIPASNGDTPKPEAGAANKEAAARQPPAPEPDKPNAGRDGPTKGPQDPSPSANGKANPLDANSSASSAERAILERLQQRRQELEKRARELDIREGLIADAEKRVESKLMQVKESQQQLVTATQKKDEAETARFKGLVTMYENMKPRDAAKIFDRLDVNVLLQVASQMSPRAMSEILALMSAERAQQLTVELANRAQGSPKNPGANLPKIEGRPTGQ